MTAISKAQQEKLARKVTAQKSRGNRTADEKEQAVVAYYIGTEGASYRTTSKKFGIAIGTVARIMRRVGGLK